MVRADSGCSIIANFTITWRHMGRGSTDLDGYGHGRLRLLARQFNGVDVLGCPTSAGSAVKDRAPPPIALLPPRRSGLLVEAHRSKIAISMRHPFDGRGAPCPRARTAS
jgi:hypothetical protein